MDQKSDEMQLYLTGEVLNDFQGAIKQEKEVLIGDNEIPQMEMHEWCPSYNEAGDGSSINHNFQIDSHSSVLKTTYYTVFKDMQKTECLECGKFLSGIRKGNIKRHYKLVHKKNIKVGREARSSDEDYADQSSMNDTQKEMKQDYAKPCNDLIIPKAEHGVDEQKDNRPHNQGDTSAGKYASPVAHYKILGDIRKTECLECGKILSGTRKLNIMRHYKLVHKKIIYTGRESSSSDDDCAEPPTKKPKAYHTLSLSLDESRFLKCCVGMVTAQNLPITIFDDREYFKTLISPYEKKFGTDINSRTIVSVLEVTVDKIINKIKKRIKSKMISLKIDVATHKNRGMLGVNIQYLKDFKVCHNTLGVIHLTKTQQERTFEHQIKTYLKDYEIDASQIYSLTTDNGTNVAKSNDLLQIFEEEDIKQTGREHIDGPSIEESIQSQLSSIEQPTGCLARAIHLAASDVFREMNTELEHCRHIINKIKVAPHLIDIAEVETSSDHDDPTCWYTTYKMLKSLQTNKESLSTVDDIINWNFIKEFITALCPLAKCAEQQHIEQYTAGDFYRDWFSCELELEDLFTSTPYARPLFEAMQNRKKQLFENVAFTSALYLDPRFNFLNSTMLSDDQKHKAVEHLVKTFEIIQNIEKSQCEQQNESIAEDKNVEDQNDLGIKESIDLQKPYAKMAKHIASLVAKTSKIAETQRTIKQKLILLSNCKMIPIQTDILHYFSYTMLDPDIAKIIEVVMAFPANQVSVVRTYSGLGVTLKKSNKNFSNTLVNNIVLCKLNAKELSSKHVRVEYPEL